MSMYRRNTKNRKGNLGFIPLNRPFKGCAQHHIDKDHVIFIPKSLHSKYPHMLKYKCSMKKINKLAWKYFNDNTNVSQRSLFEFKEK